MKALCERESEFVADYTMSDKNKLAADDEIIFQISESVTAKKYEKASELIKLCTKNAEFYKHDKSFIGTRMCSAFDKLSESLEKSVPVSKKIDSFAHIYDFDEKTPGNGYRSFLHIYDSALNYALKTGQYINENRGSLLFRKSVYLKELEVAAQMIESMTQICENLVIMHENSVDGNLYSKEYSHDNLITRTASIINQTCFYGRSIAFHYTESLRSLMRYLAVALASFSEAYYMKGAMALKTTNYFLRQPTYFLDPELCARRIMNVSRNCDVKFCKSWWWMAEIKFMQVLPQLVGYKVDVNKVFKIPTEPMKVFSKSLNKFVDIPIPQSHIGIQPITCRLLSAKKRKGMVGEKNSNGSLHEPSKYLIIHSHGGGWIANSSKSHEFYLREWAVKLDIPILSIDYSLGPKAPFPRGFEDVFYTYCWVLNNYELLGTTAENVILCGDSAGANLNTACTVKCIEMGLPTVKGILNIYAPFLVNFASSPGRFMMFVDPLLPYGFGMRIFRAYGGSKPIGENVENFGQFSNENATHEVVTDVHDDHSEIVLSPDSKKSMESMWLKVKNSSENPDWHTNLNSIEEGSPEEAVSPLIYRTDSMIEDSIVEREDDDEGLEMKISEKKSSDKKEKFVEDFIKMHDFDTPKENTDQARKSSLTPSDDNIVIDVGKEALSVQGLQDTIQSTFSNIKNVFKSNSTATTHSNDKIKRNYAFSERKEDFHDIPLAPPDDFIFEVPRNYLMSPYMAPNEILKQFPKTLMLTTIVDPCIDDCVEFAKKLRSLGVDTNVEILGALNHGFLNFAQISKECHEGSMFCLKKITELLELDENK